jgi:hypothetical protein
MYSFRSLALLLALASSAMPAALAQSSSSNPQTPTTQDQTQTAQEQAGEASVQARIKMRRDQRRTQAIHDNTGLTRYHSERFGWNFDARGYYGIAYTGLVPGVGNADNTRPKISMYNLMFGPAYRFYVQPRFSISGRVLGGVALSDFSGDTNGFGSKAFGIWPDATTFSAAGSVVGQYNVSPTISLRLTGEDVATGFGSTVQNSFGFTAGFVYRFGKP